jgi:hypothetical protein
MKVNNDPHQVVLSREMYDDLLALAKAGEESSFDYPHLDSVRSVSRLQWHVRKFNTNLHLERQAEVKIQLRGRNEARARMRKLLEDYSGKEVWQQHPSAKQEGAPVYYKVTLVGRARSNKQKVTVRYQHGDTTLDVAIGLIFIELPDNYTFWTNGPWQYLATKTPR